MVDVGGVYDPSSLLFDHHQGGFKEARLDGTPYASAGLVLRWLVEEGMVVKEVANILDEQVIAGADARDNGVEGAKAPISEVISLFNPTWVEEGIVKEDDAFRVAVETAKAVIDRHVKRISGELLARRVIHEEAVKEDGLLILPRFLPWQEAVIEEHLRVLFVIHPSKTPGQWIVQGVPVEKGSFKTRKSFSASWAGLTDEALAKESGVGDAVFCHKGLWLVVAGSKEGAIAMAKKAMQEG